MVAVSLPTSSPLLPPPLHPLSSSSTRSQCRLSFHNTRMARGVPAGSTSLRRLKVVRAVESEKGAAATTTGYDEQGGFSLLNLPEWAKWALGASVWLTLPLVKKLRDVGNLLERVDSVVEKVEEVAEKADKIAEDLAEDLPEGQLKQLAMKVEKTSEVVVSRAKVLDDILDKMSAFVKDMMNTGSKDGASGAAPPASGQDRKGGSGAVAASSSASSEEKGKPR